MRVIKYKDKINKEYAELEVDDKVALFLMSNDKMMARKQNQYDYHTLSMDTEIYNSSDDMVTLADTIADEEEKKGIANKEDIEFLKTKNIELDTTTLIKSQLSSPMYPPGIVKSIGNFLPPILNTEV